MVSSSNSGKFKSDKEAMLANIAMLYYGEGLTQSMIATRMQVSRATIVNMLKESRDRGIVEIRVEGKHLASSTLASDLCEKFSLQDVYIASASKQKQSLARKDLLPHVARAGAAAVLDIVEPGDRIGVAWGETIMAVSDVMPRTAATDTEVCQLIGSKNSVRVPASENCAIQIAGRLSATCFTLHAPGIVATAKMAEIFRTEPTIAEQLTRLSSLDMTIASIGNVSDSTHLKAAGMASSEELEAARAAGAAGIICCRFIDSEGKGIALPPEDRLIAATHENLKSARKKLLVVCGNDRADATRAAINGGLVSHLCLDENLAKILLRDPAS